MPCSSVLYLLSLDGHLRLTTLDRIQKKIRTNCTRFTNIVRASARCPGKGEYCPISINPGNKSRSNNIDLRSHERCIEGTEDETGLLPASFPIPTQHQQTPWIVSLQSQLYPRLVSSSGATLFPIDISDASYVIHYRRTQIAMST